MQRPPRVDLGLRLLALVPAALILPGFVQFALTAHGNDFGTFWRAACVGPLYSDDPLSAVQPGSGARFRNLAPPHVHVLLWPLCGWPLPVAYGVWLLANVAALVWTARLAARAGTTWRWWAWPIVLLLPPSVTLVATGQMTGLLTAAVAAAWWADRQGQAWRAGIWLGLVGAIKPFVGVIGLWWLARREWRAVVAAIGSSIASLALGLALFGRPNLDAWLRELDAVTWTDIVMNASLWGLRQRGTVSHEVILVSIALVSGVTVWRMRTADRDTGWALALTLALLISPVAWLYYAWFLLPVLMRQQLPWWIWTGTAAAWSVVLIPATRQLLPHAATVGLAWLWTGLLADGRRTTDD